MANEDIKNNIFQARLELEKELDSVFELSSYLKGEQSRLLLHYIEDYDDDDGGM